ncbi:nucleotidyltransferase [Novosphingobium sp. PhB165]|uniref:nucleotidyltransferase n=1 Tax=Novosphingobium sp. PhB165 TaxID=2485105 RepID=UPI00104CC189|nr:nucleotidyltransferase [Novosphingobium sp. PhB165]
MATRIAEALIEDLAKSLEVPISRYESTDRSYKSLARWLEREHSRFCEIHTDVYVQGSFRLGTAIRPIGADEHYDLDVVCEFAVSKALKTQKALHADLGHELVDYAREHGMDAPSPWDRVWTLNYADEARFHMDVLPCLPDSQTQRQLRLDHTISMDFVEKAVAITDSKHRNFDRISDDWPASNPNGYADWFYERMKVVFETLRKGIALADMRAEVAEIPHFMVKTPLQSAIQILKRHRDVRFSEEKIKRPSSIVITTLAAHAYQQEADISGALLSILSRMEAFVENRNGLWWIANPSDPRENFADSWNDVPDRKAAFDDWLETARTDFRRAAEENDPQAIVELLSPRLGRELMDAAINRSGRQMTDRASTISRMSRSLRRILDAPHKRPASWPIVKTGQVAIRSAVFSRDGFRDAHIASDGEALPRGGSIRFEAVTDVPTPYNVFWQIVNTGSAAAEAKDLRGNFEEATISRGWLVRTETTKYPGAHSIECFVVKNGYCVASSGPFVVNID